MSSKIIRKWLSEFKTIGKDGLRDYVTEIQQNELLIDELYDVFDEDLSPEVIDPICHQLFDFFRSLDIGLQRFTLDFVPILCRTYLFAIRNEATNDKKKYGGIEACLLGIYNIEAARRDEQVDGKKVTIPMLARPSIYHEPPSLASMALTENALLNSHPEKEVYTATGPMPQLDSINAQNRLPVLAFIMNRYNAHIAFMSPRSHKTLCKLCSSLSRSGFDSLESRSSVTSTSSGSSRARTSSSTGRPRTVTIADDPRLPLSSGYLIELLAAVYYALFNGHVRLGVQALEDIHFRACYELYSDVLLVTNAVRNSLQLNSSGQPKEDGGPMGISIILSPAQGNPVFAKDAITNASFRAKKLPEDIDVQDHSNNQLDTSFHDDGSDGDAVVSLRTSESSEKTKSSPLPKVSKGPLKSIMKKKEEKAKDRSGGHRKESESSSTSRKGSHFKEFLDLHSGKSPKHSVSVSTGLSVSVNGDAGGGDPGNAASANIVRSNSSSRSVFEIAETPKDLGRTASSQAFGVETTSFSQDDSMTRGLRNGGKSHSRPILNGTPVATEVSDGTESLEDGEEEGSIFTQL